MRRLRELIGAAQGNDDRAREDLIRSAVPFIYRTACRICGRRLDWRNDDELSVALAAFDESISRFCLERGTDFWAYARAVIRSRVGQYLRRSFRRRELPLLLETHEEATVSPAAMAEAICRHREAEDVRELAQEIELLESSLQRFGFSVSDLVAGAPRHRHARDRCLKAARVVVGTPEYRSFALKHRKLPLRQIERATGISRKVLDTWRRYIIAVVVILGTEDFPRLKAFINFSSTEPRDGGPSPGY